MKKTNVTIALLALLIPASAAAAEGDCKEAYDKGYAAGKDIQELRNEVEQLKSALAELMELDRRKMALLQKLLGEGVEIPKGDTKLTVEAPADEEKPEKRSPKKRQTGEVAGTIAFLPDSKLAYVYVENVRGRLARGRTVKISQKNKQFRPRWLVVQKGTKVSFPNEDGTYHNVFAKSPNATFDLGIYRKGDEARSYIFTQPGLVDVYCNMHSKMSAEVLVVPNHLYTRVRPDGTFKLVRVPAGRRKIVAWGPGAEPMSKFVDVAPDGTAKVQLTLRPRKQGAHTNKHGQPYGSYR